MTRPPKPNRPPPPPATVRPNELRRQQLRSYQENGRVDFIDHPTTPTNPHDSTLVVAGRSIPIPTSFSSSFDEPDNTSILRGAQILRQQFMEQYQYTAAAASAAGDISSNHTGVDSITSSNFQNFQQDSVSGVAPKRLFPDNNDDIVRELDLLGIQPIQPPGSPNDVMMSIGNDANFNFAPLDEWTTDPWNLRGSAFDPASRAIIRDQRHDDTLMGGRHHNMHPPAHHSQQGRSQEGHHHQQQQQQQQQQHEIREIFPRGEEGEPQHQRTITRRVPASSSPSETFPSPLFPTTWQPTRSFQMASSSSGSMPSSSKTWRQRDGTNDLVMDDDDKQWTSMSGTATADITGPMAYDYGDDEDGGNHARQETTRSSLSDDFASLEQKENNGLGHDNEDTGKPEINFPINRQTNKVNREDDDFLDSISLDDLEELLQSKDDKNSKALLSKWRHLRDNKGPNNSEQQQQQQQQRQQQQEPQRQQPGAVRNKSVSFAAKPSGKRGRQPQRSLSTIGMETSNQSTRRQRSRSAGGRRQSHQSYHSSNARGQSSLRDDLLCGMETQCTTDLTPEEERLSRSEIVEDACVCGDAQTNETGFHHQDSSRRRRGNKNKYNQMPPLSSSPSRRNVALREEDRFGVLSPASDEYQHMQKTNPAFQHAVTAGGLWQALVGNHVRFPKEWWQGRYRTAPLGLSKKLVNGNKWMYYDRHRIKGNRILNLFLKRRDEPGQILLHLVVRDFMTSSPILDIAIGCFHPNAKSIRTSEQASKRLEDCRDVWMAVRFRTKDVISVIDPTFLAEKIGEPKKTPLGDSKRKISNCNVRAIFGESPPLRTAFVLESDIYEMLVAMDAQDMNVHGPADILLRKYVFQSCNYLD